MSQSRETQPYSRRHHHHHLPVSSGLRSPCLYSNPSLEADPAACGMLRGNKKPLQGAPFLPGGGGRRSPIPSQGTPLCTLKSHLQASSGPVCALPHPPAPQLPLAVVTGSWLSPSPCNPDSLARRVREGAREGAPCAAPRTPLPPLPSPTASLGRRPPPHPTPPPLQAPFYLSEPRVSVPEADRRRPRPLGHDSPAVAVASAASARPLDRGAAIFKPWPARRSRLTPVCAGDTQGRSRTPSGRRGTRSAGWPAPPPRALVFTDPPGPRSEQLRPACLLARVHVCFRSCANYKAFCLKMTLCKSAQMVA